jgi:ABC-type glycerol-3-phosphate transport system substrate-binding protein
MRRGSLIVAVGGLLALAGCGGDSTETTTVTATGPATTTSATEPTTTTTDTVEDCTSKSEPNITGLSVRNMSCEEADKLTADVVQSLSRKPFSAAGFECEILGQSGPDTGPILGAEDIRCTSGDQAFRFSFGD